MALCKGRKSAEHGDLQKGKEEPEPKMWAGIHRNAQCTAKIPLWGGAFGHLRAGLHSLARVSRISVLQINDREHCPIFGI